MHLDLFSGIGGFALAVDSVWPRAEHTFCEIDPFCQAILKKHWPNSYIHEDIRTLTNTKSEQAQPTEQSGLHTQPRIQDTGVDILTGGFPCQPFSAAGKRKGTNDDRHLWPEMRRVIQEFRPRHVVAENVRGLLSIDGGLVFETVCTDLEALDYEVQPFVIPACAVGAPHRRDRVWIVAHRKSADGIGLSERTEATYAESGQPDSYAADAEHQPTRDADNGRIRETPFARLAGRNPQWDENWPQVAQRFCRVYDGVPYRLAGFTIVETRAIMGFILLLRDYFYGTSEKDGTKKILSAMQEVDEATRISELIGRYDSFQDEKILRCLVHGESNDERDGKHGSVSTKSEKIQKAELRKVWHAKLTQCPPYRRGLEQQCSCEFDDAVRELSSEIALADWEKNAKTGTDILRRLWQEGGGAGFLSEPLQALQKVWRSVTDQEIGRWRSRYYQRDNNRNAALKAYGNAIVPQVAIEILKAIKGV